jgi:hypothetical protein
MELFMKLSAAGAVDEVRSASAVKVMKSRNPFATLS